MDFVVILEPLFVHLFDGLAQAFQVFLIGVIARGLVGFVAQPVQFSGNFGNSFSEGFLGFDEVINFATQLIDLFLGRSILGMGWSGERDYRKQQQHEKSFHGATLEIGPANFKLEVRMCALRLSS